MTNLDFMKVQLEEVVAEKIVSMIEAPLPVFTARDEALPTIKGKAIAVIRMRRAGKTTFLHQCRQALMAARSSFKSAPPWMIPKPSPAKSAPSKTLLPNSAKSSESSSPPRPAFLSQRFRRGSVSFLLGNGCL